MHDGRLNLPFFKRFDIDVFDLQDIAIFNEDRATIGEILIQSLTVHLAQGFPFLCFLFPSQPVEIMLYVDRVEKG